MHCRALHRAKDSVAQWISSSGFHCAVDVVSCSMDFITQWILSHSGFHAVDFIAQWISSGCIGWISCHRSRFHHAVDFITQWICHAWMLSHRMFSRLSCSGFHHAKDFVAQRMLSRRGFSCAQATGRTAQMTGLVVNFKITF
jgi:hypothetical protein